MHSVEPVWLLYLPAAHRAQVPPLGPDEPALHVQSSAESLPDGEFARAGQLEHVDEELAEYVPAKQFAHAIGPDSTDHDPVKPLRVALPSDVNLTLRNPVDEVYTLDELRDPECLRMRCDDDSQLHL